MKWPWISGELPEEFVRRAAARGKWSFVWRIGILGWSVPLICGVNLWFNSLTRYSRFTVLVASLLLCLPAGVVVGLGLYGGTRETHEECREFWLRQRGRGKASFVWRYGVLGYGLSHVFGLCHLGPSRRRLQLPDYSREFGALARRRFGLWALAVVPI